MRWLSGLLWDRTDDGAWLFCSRVFYGTFAAAVAVLFAFVLLVDPYGVVPFSLPIKREIMDRSQRWLYPMVVRSGRYDSIVIGTSSIRLLDPNDLNRTFGGRFANLSINAATPWEQMQVAGLFRREIGLPRTIVIGIDSFLWCSGSADRERISAHGFPLWMYDSDRWNDLAYLFNGKTVEIAGRLVANRLGLAPARIRNDGYQVFLPPESSYDVERARTGIWKTAPKERRPVVPAKTLTNEERADLRFPAHVWLDDYLSALGGRSRIVLAGMPRHVVAQPVPGSHEAAIEAECIQRLATIARRHGATYVDWAIPSPITSEDSNFWDALHYRLPLASAIVEGIASAVAGAAGSSDGSFRVLVP